MSRTSSATPPPQPFFPQRNSTPTMRHAAPASAPAHLSVRHPHDSAKRRMKKLPSSVGNFGANPAKKTPAVSPPASDFAGLFDEVSTPKSKIRSSILKPVLPPNLRSDSSTSQYSAESVDSSRSLASSLTPTSTDNEHADQDMPRAFTPTPSFATTSSDAASFVTTPLGTPASSRAPSLLQPDIQAALGAQNESMLGLSFFEQPDLSTFSEPIAPVARSSWVPNFGKMAKAVVHTGMTISMPFSDKRGKKDVSTPKPGSPALKSRLSLPSPANLGESDEASYKRREWHEAEQRRIQECARLCSQWPQSGYHLAKWGPKGADTYYEPQSFGNPQFVASIMQRQAELERHICLTASTYFTCRPPRSTSPDDITETSTESYKSSQSSPAPSLPLIPLPDDRTAADIEAAMASPLLRLGNAVNPSEVSLLGPHSDKSVKQTRSMTELDALASCMALSRDDSMDVDMADSVSASTGLGAFGQSRDADLVLVRPSRAQSCGAKRPLVSGGEEEEKRRKVDEAMVIEEAFQTGVIMPATSTSTANQIGHDRLSSASAPDLAKVSSGPQPAAVFGHVVKTSDTHPIIISSFIPSALLPTLTQHAVVPPSAVPFSGRPLLMRSSIDVPSVLLSYKPNQPSLSPVPVSSMPGQAPPQLLGNLLLSSCPGKRLRMEGPIKGRGPVCRDLMTDLRRIKAEGVGCLICCLDDAELALLGVPWETYSEISSDIGLDVIRLPMPDGFTPVSMSLFDSQIALIATRYSLQGISVLVHCRGGVGRAGLTACAWAIKMGFAAPHPSLAMVEEAAIRQAQASRTKGDKVCLPAELEHQIVMSIVERVIAMIRSRRGLKAIESFEQVQFLASYTRWLRAGQRG